MYIDSWVKKHTYDTFKEILGSGMQYHLQSNEFLRNVFELGPPVMLDAAALKTMKISRFERVGFIFVSNRPKRTRESAEPEPRLCPVTGARPRPRGRRAS